MDKNGKLVFVDLFAGCGGMSLGLELAGFRPLLFCELNDSAAGTYLVNRPELEENIHRVKNILDLTKDDCAQLRSLKQQWQSDGTEVDLVCGGPPCQGYSGIGHRRTFKIDRKFVPSNHLYLEMIKVIRVLQPTMFLFENVRGLTFGKWTKSGAAGQIWTDVKNEFESLTNYGYNVPKGLVVEAGKYGVPQNRPRALIVGIKGEWKKDPKGLADGLLPSGAFCAPNVKEVLGDLIDTSYYPGQKRTEHYAPGRPTKLQHWFRMAAPRGARSISGSGLTEHEYTVHSKRIVEKFTAMLGPRWHDTKTRKQFETKKFAQRVLPAEWKVPGRPTITVTSLPDDFVHFSQPRILTVREWARLQTFPDWYRFMGPRTTGGHRRAGIPTKGIWDREVPRYTQIGNAVPVKLALAIGKHFKKILHQRSVRFNAKAAAASTK